MTRATIVRILEVWLVLAGLSGLVGPMQAQVPYDACLDRQGQPIKGQVDNSLGYAAVATIRNEQPVILWNADLLNRTSQTEQIFIYLHECGHHTLGHLYSGDGSRDEVEADCWAIQLMVDGGMINGQHLALLEASRRRVRGDDTHLGGDAHIKSLEDCLSVRTDAKAWAEALSLIVPAANDSFADQRGRLLEANGTDSTFDSLLGTPGTFDCTIAEASLRCMVFASRKGGAAEGRYEKLAKIFRNWLPAGWTSTEQPGQEKSRTFLAQDGDSGTLLVMSLRGARVFVSVRRAAL